MTARFEIFVRNLDATADFYGEVLNFDVVDDRRRAADPYVALQRDGVRVGAAERPGHVVDPVHRRPPIGVEVVLEADDLDSEIAHIRTSGWPLADEVKRQPWGLRDARLLDPDGYYLRLTERTVSPSATACGR